jgi:hypothetical protein
MLAWGTEDKEHAMSQILSTVAVIGIDIGENSFHVVGLDGGQKATSRAFA